MYLFFYNIKLSKVEILNMLAQYQQIVQVLGMHQSPLHQQSQERMTQLKQSPNYYAHLKSILMDNQAAHVKLLASVYINKFLMEKLEENQSAQIIFNYFNDLLKHQHIDNLYKRQFQKSLIKCIQMYGSKLLNQFINLSKNLIQINLCDPAFLILAAFTVPDIPSSDFYYFIATIFPYSLKPIINKVNIANAVNLNQWGKAISQVLTKLIVKSQNQPAAATSIFNMICNQAAIAKIIYQVYLLEASQGTLFTFNPELDELNLLKYEISQVHVKIVMQIFKEKLEVKQHHQVLNQCLPFFYNTLVKAASNSKLLELNHAHEFLPNIMKILTKLIKSTTHYKIFSQIGINLLNLVIFPFLATNQQQMYSFTEQPTQFVSLAQDVCDKQQFQIIKTEAASMLQALTDYIDGMLSLVVRSVISTIGCYIGISQYQTTQFKIQMDQCWTILTILSCALGKRQDLLLYIRQILEYPILQKMNDLDLCRFFLFLSYNYDQLYKDNNESGKHFLIAAYNYKGKQATMIQAIDLISNIAQSYFSEQLFISISNKIQSCQVAILWDALLTYTTKQYKLISQKNMLYLVDKLWQRMNIQFNQIRCKKKNISTLIIKSLQVIKAITMNYLYLKDKPILVSKIWLIIKTLLIPQILQQIDYEDEIIAVVDQLLTRLQVLGDNQYQILQSLQYILQTNGNVIMYLFHTLNLIIDKSSFTSQNPYLIKILQILLLGLQPNLKKIEQEQEIGQALLLVQLFIGKYANILNQNTITQIFNHISKTLTKLKNPGAIVRIYNTVLLLYPYLPSNIKYENNCQVLAIIYEKLNIFYGYQIKVATIAMSRILFTQKDIELLCQTIKTIVNLLDKLRKQLRQKQQSKQGHEQNNPHKTKRKTNLDKLKKKMEQNLKPFKNSLKKLQCNWKKLDSFQYFKNQLQTMKQNNQIAYNTMINKIPNQIITNLKQLLCLTQTTTSIRKIYKITDVKGPKIQTIAEENSQQENTVVNIEEQQELEKNKRERIIQKKKKKNKND